MLDNQQKHRNVGKTEKKYLFNKNTQQKIAEYKFIKVEYYNSKIVG